jgi:mannitol-1-/sugar-/sorbitol-6-/2-deoxyglucose-6-phosphatase
MISAAIFDMDGVLIDSEPFWRQADINAYKSVGISLTEEMCLATMGLTCIDAVKYWYQRYPWTDKDFHELVDDIENNVIQSIQLYGKPMQGVDYIIEFFEKRSIAVALASSSSMKVIEAVLTKLNLAKHFRVCHSAQFEEKGKPDPAVFISTAKMLRVKPEECLVFEDSVNGIKAGLAAGMKVVGVPEPHMRNDKRYRLANLVIHSLTEFNEHHLLQL